MSDSVTVSNPAGDEDPVVSVNAIVSSEDLKRNVLSLPFEDMSQATSEMKANYQDLLDKGKNTFGQSRYSEKHYVLNAQITPHRTHKQAMLHYDGKMHALAEAQTGKAKALAKLSRAEGDLHVLEKLQSKILTLHAKPEKLPSYKCECVEHETVTHVEFTPEQTLAFYEDYEWPDCQKHLLSELDSVITMKRAEVSQIRRGQFQQEKLEKDARREVEWYEKEIIPKTLAAAEAALANGIDYEKEEEIYWQLRNKRFIECKQLEQATGIPHDYWESISQMPETAAANLIEFTKENRRLLLAGGAQMPHSGNCEIPNTFRYKKHAAEANLVLMGGQGTEQKLLATKAQAERTTLGGICMGLLFRTEADAKEKGASDPEGMLFSPRGYDIKAIYAYGMKTDDARNGIVSQALEGGASWVFFVDDDVILPKMALRDLLDIATKNDWPIVAGDYPLKKNPYESASLVYAEVEGKGAAISPVLESPEGNVVVPASVTKAGLVEAFDFSGNSEIAIKVNGILATGCMLIRADVLRKMGGDWFKEYRRELAPGVTEMLRTDDAPFTTRAIELGFQPRLIPFIKCQHVDFKTKRVYGSKSPDVDYCINHRSNPFLISQQSGKANPRAVVYVPRRSLAFQPLTELGVMSRPKCVQLAVAEAPVGVPWAEAWTHMARQALGNDAKYMILIEDDMIVPKNAVAHLIHRMEENPSYHFICGSYVRKDMTNESAHIAVEGTKKVMVVEERNMGPGEPVRVQVEQEVPNEIPFPNPFEERGLVENNHVVCFGCSIIRTEVFTQLPFPWFHFAPAGSRIAYQGRPTDLPQTITHDAFFVRRLFGCGYRSAVDTDLQCLHVDPETGRVYGSPKFVTKDYELSLKEADRFSIVKETLGRVRVSAK